MELEKLDAQIIENVRTNIKVVKSEFLWTIKTFEMTSIVKKSPIFEFGQNKWYLKLYPFTAYGKSSATSLFLCMTDDSTANTKVQFSLTLKNAKQDVLQTQPKINYTFKPGCMSYGFLRFIDSNELKQRCQLPPGDDTMLIFCQLEYASADDAPPLTTASAVNLKMNRIFDDHLFSDFTLTVGDRQIRAHKCILAASSPVFAAMFSCDLQENRENVVVLDENVRPDVIEAMVKFMYTGQTKNVDEMAYELIGVADKYEMHDLKTICADTILQNLNVDNAAETLILADLYRVAELKENAFKFINDNAAVMDTVGWTQMTEKHPMLLCESFRNLMNAYKLQKDQRLKLLM